MELVLELFLSLDRSKNLPTYWISVELQGDLRS